MFMADLIRTPHERARGQPHGGNQREESSERSSVCVSHDLIAYAYTYMLFILQSLEHTATTSSAVAMARLRDRIYILFSIYVYNLHGN